MPFVDRFLEPWNLHDVDGALALMTDDCVWEVTRGREPHGTLHTVGSAFARRSWRRSRRSLMSTNNLFGCGFKTAIGQTDKHEWARQ